MKEIMDILNKNGYESYVVGGYVRDYLLGITSYDVDICTNAPIEVVEKIFNGKGKSYPNYYAYHLSIDNYEYDITTYRKELKYEKNKPVDISIANDLYTDLLRRDFTINALAMDSEFKIIDLLDSKKDLDNKIIKCIGDTNYKFNEDKTRIMRAFRFAFTLDFEFSNEIKDFINNKIKLLEEVPKEYKRKELDKIFENKKYYKFLKYIKEKNIENYFNIKFDVIVPSNNKYEIWAQIETDLPFTKKEKRIIKSIKERIS